MNTNVSIGIAFVVGAGVGALATWKIVKDKYQAIADEEIESMKEAFLMRDIEDAKDPVSEITDEQYKPIAKKILDKYPQGDALDDMHQNGKTVVFKKHPGAATAYNDMFKSEYIHQAMDPAETQSPPEDEPEEDEEDINGDDYGNQYVGPLTSSNGSKHSEPYVITVEAFQEEMPNFEKLSISYYDGDDTLADEQEEIIAEQDAIVGDEALLCFGEGSNDPDIVYVRNEQLGVDYEVIRLHKKYQEEVLGIHNVFEDRNRRTMRKSDEED